MSRSRRRKMLRVATLAAATTVATTATISGASADDLAQLRQCESGGNYSTNTGNGFYGAYQFTQSTWSSLGMPGRPDQASPAMQDKAAVMLANRSGMGQWPVCGAGRRVDVRHSAISTHTVSHPSAVSRPTHAAKLTRTPRSTSPCARTSPGGASFGVLSMGAHGGLVSQAQRKLHVSADGVYGSRTASAVRSFQVSKGLQPDGVIGKQTNCLLKLGVAKAFAPPTTTQVVLSAHVAAPARASKGSTVVAIAAQQLGKPYRFGAEGPSAFDCSGLVQYVYGRVGIRLPRTVAAIRATATRVSTPRPGDLVFYGTEHVAIYTGNGQTIVASHTGTPIRRQAIYSSAVSYGRLV